jgi:DNA-binding GntR family transcriptional regulator
MIVNGDIPDGQRINEVQLSQQLGISRTPIREGLGQLIAEQFVEIIPRRGFFARELTAREFSDLYDLRPLLDPVALTLGGQPSPLEIDAIDEANETFLNATSGVDAVIADEVFHKLLLVRCPNAVLMGMIDNLMVRTRRYELALFRSAPPQQAAVDQHAQIIAALREGDLPTAADRLRDNLSSGKAPILEWLAARHHTHKEKS